MVGRRPRHPRHPPHRHVARGGRPIFAGSTGAPAPQHRQRHLRRSRLPRQRGTSTRTRPGSYLKRDEGAPALATFSALLRIVPQPSHHDCPSVNGYCDTARSCDSGNSSFLIRLSS
jgi:hypothetical protein